MKLILFLFSLLVLFGCDQSSTPQTLEGTAAIRTCSDERSMLSGEPTKVTLVSRPTKLSGSIQSGEDVAYSFEGKKGQTLSYSSLSDTLCAVIYSWDLEKLEVADLLLPADGKYTLQLSSLEDAQDFEITMGLDVGAAAASPLEPAASSAPTLPKADSKIALPEAEAVKIVQSWLDAKPRIFAPPFDLTLVNTITIANGPLHQKTTGSSGSVQWLKDNGNYYTYKASTINRTVSYQPAANNRLALKVEITEDLSLHSPRGIDRSGSGQSTGLYEYLLEKEGATWKIYSSAASG